MSYSFDRDVLHAPTFAALKTLLAEDFVDIMHVYMQDSNERIKRLRHAQALNNNRTAYEAAHALKGASANLGANRLSQLCQQLQQVCHAQQLVKQHQLIEQTALEVARVNAAICRCL